MLKLSAAEDLIQAIRLVAAGEIYLDKEISERITDSYVRTRVRHATPRQKDITDREEEVLRLIAEGYSNKEIAAQLGISVKTVESHKSNLMEKLELTSRPAMVRYQVRRGSLQHTRCE